MSYFCNRNCLNTLIKQRTRENWATCKLTVQCSDDWATLCQNWQHSCHVNSHTVVFLLKMNFITHYEHLMRLMR